MREELQALATLARPGELGNLTRAAENARAEWRWQAPDELAQDLRYASRSLRRNLSFTLVAVLTLGVGLGAAITAFSAIRTVLLRSLPYAAPDRLVAVSEPGQQTPAAGPTASTSTRAFPGTHVQPTTRP